MLLDELKNKGIIKPNGKLHIRFRKKLDADQTGLGNQIIKATHFLNPKADMRERIHCIIQDITEVPKCKTCKKEVQFRIDGKYRNTYPVYCSSPCFSNDENIKHKRSETVKKFSENKKQSIRNKRKQTNMERYGVEAPSTLPNMVEKRRQTNLQRYGDVNSSKNIEVQQRRKQTNLERYGFENAFSNPKIREKQKQTNMKKYGVENVWHLEQTQHKRFEKMKENHGVEYALQSSEINKSMHDTMEKRHGARHALRTEIFSEKFQDTMNERFGVDHPSQDRHLKNKATKKRIQTNLEKYGTETYHESTIDEEIRKKLNDKNWLHDQHNNQQKSLTRISEELDIAHSTVGLYMKKHGLDVIQRGTSQAERDISDFILSLNVDVISNVKTLISPYEIDMFLPDYNVAIEYNGIFWHSELNGRGRKYHLNKTEKCNERGIRLVHIFETEWLYKQDIVKSRLINLVQKSHKIFARKCIIKKLSPAEKNAFLNDNHIQGDCASSINCGLLYEGELVSCMTFVKSRYSKKHQYELARFANKLGYCIVGGAGKLFKHFIRSYTPTSVASYSDRRWNLGKLYINLGFTHSHYSDPNYFYFKYKSDLELRSRVQFQKHKLEEKLEVFDPELSEWENMQNNGYDRIWDCGNSVYVWKK